MKFVTVRDLRIRPGTVWQWLREGGPLVLTSHGKPFAVMAQTDEEHLVDDVTGLQCSRARAAVSRIRQHAKQMGTDNLPDESIQEIVDDARREAEP